MTGQIDKGGIVWRLTPDLLSIVDATGVLRDTNPAWQATLGWTAEELGSATFFEFMHPDDYARSEIAFEEVLAGKLVLGFENRYRHKAGGYRWLSWNAIPHEDVFYCTARDITADKERQAKISVQDSEAELREQFIAVLSHDLRNPLAALDASSRMIGRASDDPKIAELVAANHASVRRMASLIDDVTDFAQIRLGGGIRIQKETVEDLRAVLKHTVEELRLAHRDVEFQEVYGPLGVVDCDPDRVAQMLSNLLSNAVTHGAPGKPVQIRAERQNGTLSISVENEGEDIPHRTRQMIFQPFTRSEVRESQNGLGLGLYIANGIAQNHGGTLDLSTSQGRVVFSFSMPVDAMIDQGAPGPVVEGVEIPAALVQSPPVDVPPETIPAADLPAHAPDGDSRNRATP